MKEAHHPLRVLIAEDLVDLAETLAFLLRAKGYEVELAFDGLAAVHLASVFRPEFILLDIEMPKLDGFQAAWQIRQRLGRDVKVIALTCWNRDEDKASAELAGFDEHLSKPVNLALLFQKLEELGGPKPAQVWN